MLNNNFSGLLTCGKLCKYMSAFNHKQFITLHPDSWVNSICALRIFWNGSIHRPSKVIMEEPLTKQWCKHRLAGKSWQHLPWINWAVIQSSSLVDQRAPTESGQDNVNQVKCSTPGLLKVSSKFGSHQDLLEVPINHRDCGASPSVQLRHTLRT